MQTGIIIQFLLWFYKKILWCKAVLLLDSFHGHGSGIQDVEGELGLANRGVIFLLANTRSK